jgi:hypothetical protein
LDILRLGYDDPEAIQWMWEHHGTTMALRRVEEVEGQGWRVRFFSADWTPWPVLASIRRKWVDVTVRVKTDI